MKSVYTLIAKIIYFIIKTFKLGSGFTWPGYFVLKLFPNALQDIFSLLPSNTVIVSGTNGKTTTTKLIANILTEAGFKTLSNDTGSNLLQGLLTSILLRMSLSGSLPVNCAILEVDEAVLPKILPHINPRIICLLNLSRDQLDRHWEVDLIYTRWLASFKLLSSDTKIFYSSVDSIFADLPTLFPTQATAFSTADINEDFLESSTLYGSFNLLNLACALKVTNYLNIAPPVIVLALKSFEPAYGRGELITYRDKSFRIFLAKNPASLNANLDMLKSHTSLCNCVLFILNDNVPDGHDVSWIFDVDPTILKLCCENRQVYVSGSRALDMAVRLCYAGVNVLSANVNENLEVAVNQIVLDTSVSNIVIFPNYSAMLQVRKVVVGRSIQ
ncbi:DUF1727 domain-containing protein [Patescibacteria group bacterium]|nr:DUF1727 domain-containing protein [Patescibacteria group bacterium]